MKCVMAKQTTSTIPTFLSLFAFVNDSYVVIHFVHFDFDSNLRGELDHHY